MLYTKQERVVSTAMNEMIQPELPFSIKEIERDGIVMGVLSDGTPYLTGRGLARMCGVENSVIFRLTNNWQDEKYKPRGQQLQKILSRHGYDKESLFTKTMGPNGETHAYTDAVCMSFLEYYAFDAQQVNNETARNNYRLLATQSFRAFIYSQVGYNPEIRLAESWKNFEKRVLLNASVPVGYFSIFREMADFIVQLIRGGIIINEHTIPDISVGIAWAKLWTDKNYDSVYGERIKHPHFYPENYPQAAAEIYAWIYPDKALPVFRKWLQSEYTSKRFQKYLENKVAQGFIEGGNVPVIMNAVTGKNAIVAGKLPTSKMLKNK